ncbi:MAG TPA: class I SAM-dependent methyltransferase [Geminicoccaceae bacterium]|nr:class I SAM-dependent methyltransferase [Geminicoccaceae bacterium]
MTAPPAAAVGALGPAAPVVAGNVYPKYETRNPVARLLVSRFLAALAGLVARTGAADVHEVGCGEGFLAAVLAAGGRRLRGTDLSPEAVAQARDRARAQGLDAAYRACDLYDLDPGRGDAAGLIVCCEVLEHLPDPARAVDVLARLARPHLIASVPREPLWRALNVARGRYLCDLGNTPGHLQHWSKPAFLALLRTRFEVVEVRSPLPWTMALCRNPAAGG